MKKYIITNTDYKLSYTEGDETIYNETKKRYLKVSTTGCVTIKVNDITRIVRLFRLVSCLRCGIFNINHILDLTREYKKPDVRVSFFINKTKSVFNLSKRNIFIGNAWEYLYYKHINDNPELVTNLTSDISNSSLEYYIDNNLILIKPLIEIDNTKSEKYYVCSNGYIINLNTASIKKGVLYKRYKKSISKYTYANKKHEYKSEYSNRILFRSLRDTKIGVDDIITGDSIRTLKIDTRSNYMKEFHLKYPEHYDNLKTNSNFSRELPVVIDNKYFPSIKEASVYVYNDLKHRGVCKCKIEAVLHAITIRRGGNHDKHKKLCNKLLYNKYTVIKSKEHMSDNELDNYVKTFNLLTDKRIIELYTRE